ncbi:MAG TPA: hypothetical protein VGA46_10720 [Methyloceanibacter sp.]
MDEAAQAFHVKGAGDAVGRRTPHAAPLGPCLPLPRHKLGDTGPDVGQGIDAGEPLGDHLLLEPKPRSAADHEDLGERMTVAVATAPAESELDFSTGGEARKGILGLIDQRPGVLAAPAERRHRRLGPDQPYRPAVGKLKRLAIDDSGDRAGLRLRKVAGQCGRTEGGGEPSRSGTGIEIGHPPDHSSILGM